MASSCSGENGIRVPRLFKQWTFCGQSLRTVPGMGVPFAKEVLEMEDVVKVREA